MTVAEKIRLLLGRRSMTITSLAANIGISRQYLTKCLNENSFNIKDLKAIAVALNCSFEAGFVMNDTREKF